MAIKIGSLTRERREGKVSVTFDEGGEVQRQEIRISFLKPTETLWRELLDIEKQEGAEQKTNLVAQLIKLDLQSPDITNEDGTVRQLCEADLQKLDWNQLAELWAGVRDHFFLQMPVSPSETTTSSSSAQTAV
jgi:hypothetical protein